MRMLHKPKPNLLFRLLPRTAASILVAAVIALPAGAGTAIALADNGDTSAVAINTRDGSSIFKLTFAVRQVSGNVVDSQNAAVAFSSCSDCQTVAISIEVVLASGNPTTVAPVNEAIAINENCTSCDTLAAAYQFVYALDTKLKLTAEGHQQLADIHQQLEQLRNSGLSIEQINTQVGTLMGQLTNVLNHQLIAVNEPAAGPDAATAATTPSNPSPTSNSPTDTTTTPTNTPADTTPLPSTPADTTTTPTSTPSDTTTPTSTPTDITASPTSTPTDTTTSGAATNPTTPTSTGTTTSPTTTGTTTSPTTTGTTSPTTP